MEPPMSNLYRSTALGATRANSPRNRVVQPLVGIRAIDPPADPATALDGAAIADVQAYIDTLELTFRSRPKGLLAEARRIIRRKIWFKEIRDGSGNRWAVKLICHQPSPELLDALDKYAGVVSQLDVAFDIWPREMSTEQMAAFVRSNAILRWRRKANMHEHKTTLYWSVQHPSLARPDRNLAEYHDKPSKLRVDGKPVVHLELRLQTAEAIKKEKIRAPSDLASLNPRQLFDKHLRIIAFSDHIASDIRQAKQPRRTEGFYSRFYGNRAQRFKDCQPQLSAKLAILNGRLILSDALSWGARSGSKDHLTWKAISPSSAIIS
jgi:hypothetical protein